MSQALHKLVELAIRRVCESNPAFSWISAYEDIQRLNELAWAIDNPSGADKVALLDVPVHCGDVTLWRLSYAAVEWLTQCAEPWYAGDQAAISLAWAWAMAHSRDPAAIRAAWRDQDAGMRMVDEWLLSIRCSVEALIEAVQILMPKPADTPRDPSAKPAELGEILDTLMSEYSGTTADHWLFEIPGETLRELWDRIETRKMSETAMRLGVPIKAIGRERRQRAHWMFSKAVREFDSKHGRGQSARPDEVGIAHQQTQSGAL